MLSPAMRMQRVFKPAVTRTVIGGQIDLAASEHYAIDGQIFRVDEAATLLAFFELIARWDEERNTSNGN